MSDHHPCDPPLVTLVGQELHGLVAARSIQCCRIAKTESVPTGIAHAVGGLSLVNIALAVFW